jgi:uncharacterized coiled-coil protein SlyX
MLSILYAMNSDVHNIFKTDVELKIKQFTHIFQKLNNMQEKLQEKLDKVNGFIKSLDERIKKNRVHLIEEIKFYNTKENIEAISFLREQLEKIKFLYQHYPATKPQLESAIPALKHCLKPIETTLSAQEIIILEADRILAQDDITIAKHQSEEYQYNTIMTVHNNLRTIIKNPDILKEIESEKKTFQKKISKDKKDKKLQQESEEDSKRNPDILRQKELDNIRGDKKKKSSSSD